MENIVELYYERLKSTTNAGQLLSQFYGELTGKVIGKAEVIMFNRLLKVFGRFTVFFSTLELGKYEEIQGVPYALLYTICKNRFEREFQDSPSASSTNLDRALTALEKEIERVSKSKIKFPDSAKLGEINDGKSL